MVNDKIIWLSLTLDGVIKSNECTKLNANFSVAGQIASVYRTFGKCFVSLQQA